MEATTKAKRLYCRLHDIKKEIENLEAMKENIVGKINKELDKSKTDVFEFEEDGFKKKIYRVRINSVKYDMDKMKDSFEKSIFNKMIDKSIRVETGELREVLEEYPKLKKILKKALIVEKSVNNAKVNSLIEKGIISISELSSFAEVLPNSYIKITEKQMEE